IFDFCLLLNVLLFLPIFIVILYFQNYAFITLLTCPSFGEYFTFFPYPQLILKCPQDIGVVAYHDNPLKEILLNGITTIATDFRALGSTAAKFILEQRTGVFTNPSKVILRESL
ncbi:MAG: substrate-binding domain-containing protein, partial [Bacteroidota bacterium]